jgi:hypothetical protein
MTTTKIFSEYLSTTNVVIYIQGRVANILMGLRPLPIPVTLTLESLRENGYFEALEGRPNVIAPREASRNGG